MKSKSVLHLSTIAFALSSAHAAPLLTDNFNTPSYGASTFNNYLAADQAGSLAQITYTTSAPGGDWSTQHSNGGAMIVVNAAGNNWVSLNHDFSIEANLANKPLVIQFNAQVDTGVSYAWLGFGIGPAQGTDFYSQPYGFAITRESGIHNYKFVFSDTAGTGSAFNGVTDGAKVEVFIDGVSQGSTTRTMSPGGGYFTFKQDQWDGYSIGVVDNLSIEMDAPFPGGETLTWTGATDANWDEATANWSNVNSFTKWYSNTTNLNSVVFDATGAAQPNPTFSLTRPLTAASITFDTTGYNLGGSVTLGNSPNLIGNAEATVSATLAGNAGITKSGASKISLSGTSSYTGVTTLQDGVLNAASFADNGTNSSLGAGTGDTNPNAIGLLFRGGTLQYTGTTAQSTNRAIRVGTEGGTIDASGSVPSATLSFTSTASPNLFYNPGARTLTFTGTNSGDNTFAMAIADAGGSTSVVKDGAGKWILSGANTYTGGTTVNDGTLSLTSPYLENSSTVSIGTGAKLDLNFTGNDVIGSLEINGSGPLPGGIYNSSTPTYGSYFTGSGSLIVINGQSGSWISTVDGIWDDTANWSGGIIASGFDQTATFNAATGVTVTLSAAKTIGNLAFDVSDYALAGPGTLTLDSSTMPAIGVSTGRTATINANLAGIYGMQKTGAGSLVLTAGNTFSGETLVAGGLLQLGASPVSNPQFGALENSYQLTIGSGATVRAMGANAFKGWNGGTMNVTLNGGTLTINDGVTEGGNHNLGYVILNGGTISGVGGSFYGGFNLSDTVEVTENSTISATNTNTLGAARTIIVNDGKTLDWSGTIIDFNANNGPTSLNFQGTGTTVLSGVNAYTGNTTVNDGSLQLTSTSQMQFVVTDAPASNQIGGTGAVSFDGVFNINTSAVAGTTGYIWLLVDRTSLSGESFGSNFSVAGFTPHVDGVTWTMSDSRGTWTFSEDTGELTLDIGNDYDTWKADNGVTGGPNDDDDNDGLSNHEEYAFGLDPTGGSSVNPIAVQLDKATGNFSYTRRLQSLTGLTYSIWYSTDLATWIEDTGALAGTPTVNGDVETVPVTISSSLLANPKLFVQVRAN